MKQQNKYYAIFQRKYTRIIRVFKKNPITKPEWHYIVLEAITRNNVIIIRRRQRMVQKGSD